MLNELSAEDAHSTFNIQHSTFLCATLAPLCPPETVFGSPSPIVVIDNYDSFTYNLVQQIERLAGAGVRVLRNDAFDPAALLRQKPRAIVISPGPGTPSRAGRIVDLI